MHRAFFGLMLLGLTVPGSAFAQTGKHVAVGAGMVVREYTESDFTADQNPSPSFEYRIRLKPESRQGWHWTPSGAFDWFRADTKQNIAGASTQFGQLHAKPVMVGIGREYSQGPLNINLSVVAGPSFNDFSIDDAARVAYRTRRGVDLTDVSTKTSLAVRPGVGVWYDLGRWFAVGGSVDYMVNRIDVDTTAGGVRSSTTWKTDHLGIHLGIVVGIF
jgi:hypothetical protein